MNSRHQRFFAVAITTFFIAITASGQVASDKKMKTFLSSATIEKLDRKRNSGLPGQQARNIQNLPSAKLIPDKAIESKLKRNQKGIRTNMTLPDSEMKKRLPSNSFQPHRLQKSRPKIVPPSTPSSS